jgi:hypothetical protein
MKKFFFTIALLILGLIATAQIDTTKMSNYEKYVLAKEQTAKSDTIFKTDTVFVNAQKPEYDDLYWTPSKDQLKRKAKDLRLEKKKIRLQQDLLYYDAKQEVYNDLSFTAEIYRFHRPYYFPYYSYYWDPFYDPWFLDSWYWGWNYPYYHNYWYNYPFYSYPNYWWEWDFPRYYSHNVSYERHERYRAYSLNGSRVTPRPAPVIVNRTIQVDRRKIYNKPSERPTYSPIKRDYIPSYTTPRTAIRPQYNNSKSTTTPSRNYSAPSRPSVPSYKAPSRSYSAPNRSYSAPTQSSRSYSAPSNNSSRSYSSKSSSGRR